MFPSEPAELAGISTPCESWLTIYLPEMYANKNAWAFLGSAGLRFDRLC